MTTIEQNKTLANNPITKLWLRIPLLIRAVLVGGIVSTLGTLSWPLFITFLPAPAAVAAIIVFLVAYWKYFSGTWGGGAAAEVRKLNFRSTKISRPVWKWSLAAAFFFVVVFQSSLMVTFRFTEFPADTFNGGLGFDALPLWAAWLGIFISAAVAGICEEIGFRGYMQVPLEKKYGPKVAVLVVSLAFVGFHLHQAWLPPLLIHLFSASVLLGLITREFGSLLPAIIAHISLDIFNFSYWWSDIAGKYDQQILSQTGVDAHFITWLSIFVLSSILLFWTISKTQKARLQNTIG